MSKQKKSLILVSVLALITLIGSSYALLRSSSKGTNAYVMNVANLEVHFKNNSTNTLTLEDAYPMTDEEGLAQSKELVFTVRNDGNLPAYYDVYMQEQSNDIDFKDVIRYSVNKNNTGYGEVLELDNNMLYLDKCVYIDKNTEISYKVKVWLKETAGSEYMHKTASFDIKVDASQKACDVEVTFDNGNLIYGLENTDWVTSSNMKYKIEEGVITVQALRDDGEGFTTGRVYLEANKTYIFNSETDGVWGEDSINGENSVESFLVLNGEYSTYYCMESNGNFEFTPTKTGTYWLRLDVNKNGETHTFSNLSIVEKDKETKTVTYNDTYGELPTLPERVGYTFMGWTYSYDDYQELEYIESTGTQYIDTGVFADINTIIELEAMCVDTRSSQLWTQITGARESYHASSSIQIAFRLDTNDVVIDYGTDAGGWITIGKNVKFTVHLENNNILVNNTILNQKGTFSGTSPYSLWIFALNKAGVSGEPFIGRIYNYKLYNGNTILRNYVPVKKISTGEIGLLDKVEKKFYENQGTGTFNAGSNRYRYIDSSSQVASKENHTLKAIWEEN